MSDRGFVSTPAVSVDPRGSAPSGLRRALKRGLVGAGALAAVLAGGVSVFVAVQVRAFEASMDKVYDVPAPAIARSTDAAVVERGKHVVEAVAGCASADCHGADLAGGKTLAFGPLGHITGPNITSAGVLGGYTDAEIARLVRHGIKRDGRSVRFMPVGDFAWLPDDDVRAVVSYLRAAPAVEKPNGPTELTALGKVLDRQDKVTIDVARRIDHTKREALPARGPTAEYGAFLARACTGCHGEHLSGGPIPGAPSTMPVPRNLTPDATGLAGWTFEDFERALTTGNAKGGRKLDPFMPYEAYAKLDGDERRALWAYVNTLPKTPFGGR